MDFLISIVFLTNSLRLHSLKEDVVLDMEAQIRAELLCSTPFSHTGFQMFNPGYKWFGENLAMGIDSPVSVVVAWYKSPSHRANMLNKHYSFVGVGRFVCKDGTSRTVEMFGGK